MTTKSDTTKKAFDLARDSVYVADPTTELCLIGAKLFPLTSYEKGPLDTNHDAKHALFDERLGLPLDSHLVANINAYGVMVPIIIAKIEGLAVVVDGRQRVRAARVVNAMREERGEPPLKIKCVVRRSSDAGLLGAMIVTNEARVDDEVDTKIAKLKRYMERGVSLEDAAITFGKSAATLKAWLEYDDNAIASVKKAVDSGRVSQSAVAHIAKLKDPAAQQQALDKLLAAAPVGGGKISRRDAKLAAKSIASGGKEVHDASDKRTQKKLLAAVQETKHPTNASQQTLAWWQGVEHALALVIGEDTDKRLTDLLAKVRAAK